MTKNGKYFCNSFLRQNYFWKLLSIACVAYLFTQLLLDLVWIKPTFTSTENIQLTNEIFPDILVCKEHGFNLGQLNISGYKDQEYYLFGSQILEDKGSLFVGWNGWNNTDTVRQVLFIKL